ncbi:metastasis-associated protein MTA3 isoform X2 [Chironomus tepperi]|uniref:metastasis-associated protein MTA3 isoform X2 n=1 Tax=Chironomus tepperi TaxID=113505 RepID=UPI00391F3AEA
MANNNNSTHNKMYSESTYRVGDYVYFETSSSSPYQIRRIEELNKTPSGNVEAKVMCFYRRRDLPTPLVQLADKHQMATAEDSDSPVAMKLKKMWLKTPVSEEQAAQAVLDPAIAALEEEQRNNANSNGTDKSELSNKQKHQMKHRELFLSRQVETLPATHIRGKCSVTLLNEEESLLSYLNKDDTFFYCLVFDPTQKTLLADKGEIRVGSRYQTELQHLLKDDEIDERKLEELETLVWTPHHNLTDRKIDQFLVVSRSVGTFARALDCSSSVKQPSLHMSAAAASRDITLFHAMDTLHKHNYSIEAAMCSLVPSSGPVLCRDEMEEWSASEANLFEEALDKYGKDFNDIRNDFLPWKTLKNIVEYYYMWKTTDRYVQQKRVKAVEAESKLKQVYIPNYTKPSPALITNNSKSNLLNGTANGNNDIVALTGNKPCESCSSASSPNWYTWGPSHLTCRLCQTCWNYWKKYGGLKTAASRLADNDVEALKKRPVENFEDEEKVTQAHRQSSSKCTYVNCGKEFKLKAHLARHYAQAHGIAIRSNSPRPIMKTRSAFYLQTTVTTKLSRKLCRHVIKSKKAARQPSYAVSLTAVKNEFAIAIAKVNITDIKTFLKYKKKDRGSVTLIANRLGNPATTGCEWLKLTPKDMMPKPEKVAFPKPPKGPDGSLIYERIPNKATPEPEKFVIPNTIGCTIITPSNIGMPQSLPNLPASVTATPISAPLPPSGKRRAYELNGLDPAVAPPPTKRPNKDPMPSFRPSPEQYAAMIEAAQAAGQPLPRTHMNGKPKIAQMSRSGSGRKQVISWMDAPDDYYFRPTENNKRSRRNLSVTELRRLARRPWRKTSVNNNFSNNTSTPDGPQVVILD